MDGEENPNLALHTQLSDHASDMYLAGLHKEARRAVERAIELLPECYLCHMLLSSILCSLDEDDEELAIYDKCIAMSPTNPEAYAEKADFFLARHRIEEAEALAIEARALHRARIYEYPDDAEMNALSIYTVLASAQQHRGNLDEVEALVREAAEFSVSADSFQFFRRPLLRVVPNE